MRADIVPGGTFPDYELPDQDGDPRRLSHIQNIHPMVLVLSRGSYCPKDQTQLRNLTKLQPEIDVAYTRVAVISTDDGETSRRFREDLGARWPFLSDPERTIQRDLDIKEYTDPRHNPMIPYTLVLGPGLVIHSVYNGYWFWGRPSNEDLRHDLREVTRLSRPDWDLSAPGLKEAWEVGDKSRHFPYPDP